MWRALVTFCIPNYNERETPEWNKTHFKMESENQGFSVALANRREYPRSSLSFKGFFKRWSCGFMVKRNDPPTPLHAHTKREQHQSRLSNTGSYTNTQPRAMRTVLHEHTHYISLEVRQKSKALTRQVKGIQRLEAAQRRG